MAEVVNEVQLGAPVFIGDGQYPGDGGRLLQMMWDSAPWKMIKNCPGRYIIKHKKSNPVLIEGAAVTTMDAHALVAAVMQQGGADDRMGGMMDVHDELQSERCGDNVQIVIFRDPGGGGVITYCKSSAHADSNETRSDGDVDTVYVHTLNTASGLKRKLTGLRLAHVLPKQDDDISDVVPASVSALECK